MRYPRNSVHEVHNLARLLIQVHEVRQRPQVQRVPLLIRQGARNAVCSGCPQRGIGRAPPTSRAV
jgi:hypothetical protein